jgi:hypothetical protein
MRLLLRLGVLGLAGYGAKTLYDQYFSNASSTSSTWGSSPINLSATSRTPAPSGRDTATGTDPNAKYAEPGYQDKSIGQAVSQDEQLVDRLLDETHGDVGEAQSRFRTESAGSPALARQENETGSGS